jgi:hypothetical protein
MIVTVDLDHWLPAPTLRIAHSRESSADADALWSAARSVRLAETGLLGRLVRWRIPGTELAITFDELFRNPPFVVLGEQPRALASGLVGRIWTLRRDYPRLSGPDEFREWSAHGTARVLFANWVDGERLYSEARVDAFGVQGRMGLAAVRPLVASFHHLIGAEGLEAAVRQAGASAPDVTRS